jgi:hypothetical protein
MTFRKDKIAQRNGSILGCFLIMQIYYIFTLISSFKTWFIVRILRFLMGFDVDVLDFQIELCCRYFGFFCLGDCLGYFLKNWVIYFQIFWSPWFLYSFIHFSNLNFIYLLLIKLTHSDTQHNKNSSITKLKITTKI